MAKASNPAAYFSPSVLIFCLPLFFFPSHGDDQENVILLSIKAHWSSAPALSSWNNFSPHCNWPGIQCSNGSVTQISLRNLSISEPIPSLICKLDSLTHLDLYCNDIPGHFPTSLYNCSSLQYLDLSQNLFVGALPDDIDKMSSQLAHFDLSGNNFTGDVPPSIGRLLSLRTLYLHSNLFNGSFPPELGNLSLLQSLYLAYNPFASPRIPSEFGNMTRLKYLWIAQANLVGDIPGSLGTLSELEHLDLAMNHLNGSIPASIWSLEKLKIIYLFSNNLSGEINVKIAALNLEEIDVSMNLLTGSIPKGFGKIINLGILCMYSNQLSGEIPKSIGFLRYLYDIRLFDNQLDGVLPPELGKHSMLQNLEVANNRISGSLPDGLCANRALTSLVVFNNNLTGEVLASLADCYMLGNIMLYNNRFSGEFPLGIWSTAVNLTTVLIHHNNFSGALPDKLLWNLTRLEIHDNKFSGKIPSLAPRLAIFNASNNMFSGEITLTGMSQLQVLSLDGNRISGSIPMDISSLKFLTVLNLSNNKLSGGIPTAMGSLPVLTSLDLSHNRLSGSIPPEIGNLQLSFLDVSYNQLSGEIPPQLQNQAYKKSFLSNPGLCSSKAIVNLNICGHRSGGHDKFSGKLITIFSVLGGVLLLMTVVLGAAVRRRRSDGDNLPSWKVTSFHQLDFTEDDIIRGLTDENFIGSGGSGQVYRIYIGNRANEYVAVKKIRNNRKLNCQVEKTFEAEVKILSSIRHSNIVKLLCCISSENTKLLVYEYMENKSLDRWLHRTSRRARVDSGRIEPLDWEKRIKIAIDVAKGLCYMHHHCRPPVIHRDIKPSNILLDSEFRAKIADFGLARIRVKAREPESGTIAGTFGYMAPEYRFPTRITEKVDVYSFGVVLLELTTGRRAQDGGEHEGLAGWAGRCLKKNGVLSFCPLSHLPCAKKKKNGVLLEMIADELRGDLDYLKDMATVLLLGVACTRANPSLRPSMKDVIKKLMDCDRLNGCPRNPDAASLLQMKGSCRKKFI